MPINLDEKQSKVTHWALFFIDRNATVCFDFFGMKYNPQDILNKKITHIAVYLEYNLMILLCVFYCIAFTEYIIAGKTFRLVLLDFTNLFSPND